MHCRNYRSTVCEINDWSIIFYRGLGNRISTMIALSQKYFQAVGYFKFMALMPGYY